LPDAPAHVPVEGSEPQYCSLCGADHRILWSADFVQVGRRHKPPVAGPIMPEIVCPTEVHRK
jgi:hypothetical protein